MDIYFIFISMVNISSNLTNIDIYTGILQNIDVDKAILKNIDIDKITKRLEFGISNMAMQLVIG